MLVRDRIGPWSLPGGVVDEEEGPLQALEREFLEELGTRPVDPVLIGVYHTMPYDGIRMAFRCGIEGEPTPASEIVASEYVEPGRRLDELAPPFIVDRILDALEFSGRVAVREQRRDNSGNQVASRPRPW